MCVNLNCPYCGAILKDWRRFVANYPELAAEGEKDKPFECTGFRCGKRWDFEAVLQQEEKGENRKKE